MMNSLNLTLSEKHFIFPSILNDSFAGYSNLEWRSHGGLSTGEWEGERRGKVTENK